MQKDEPFSTLGAKRFVLAVAVGLIAGFAIVLAPYCIVWLFDVGAGKAVPASVISAAGYNNSVVALFPFVQGFAAALTMGRARYHLENIFGIAGALLLVEIVLGMVFLHEGVICVIMAAPVLYICMLAGAGLGRVLARRMPQSRTLQVSLVPLLMLAVVVEAIGPKPDYAASVADSVVIDAPPEYVWRYVVQYPENTTPPNYWLWSIGLPYPTQSVAEAPRVGAKRLCKFSGGYAFEERIVELRPNALMRFAVTKQPDHPEVTGHFRFDEGEIALTRNANGSTTITATSRYRLFVRPAFYFDLWTADVTRQIHFRVLNRMKALAEADFRRDQRASTNPP